MPCNLHLTHLVLAGIHHHVLILDHQLLMNGDYQIVVLPHKHHFAEKRPVTDGIAEPAGLVASGLHLPGSSTSYAHAPYN